jgi:phosphoglycerate dehydrogenase-like enzyme
MRRRFAAEQCVCRVENAAAWQAVHDFTAACEKHGIKVGRVPTYSPTSVAEHALALLFALNRYDRRSPTSTADVGRTASNS